MNDNEGRIYIYTDGSCPGNPGPGGYAALIEAPGEEIEVIGSEKRSTNIRMEMTAAIKALEAVSAFRCPITVYSDNEVLVRGMNEWTSGWAAGGWRKSNGRPVQNRDLWERLISLDAALSITWQHVRAHSGLPMNERADGLATAAATRQTPHEVHRRPRLAGAPARQTGSIDPTREPIETPRDRAA